MKLLLPSGDDSAQQGFLSTDNCLFPVEHSSGKETRCAVCGSNDRIFVTKLPFQVRAGEVQTLIRKCGNCGCYWREFHPGTPFDQHWELQSYTKPQHESTFRRARQPFFTALAKWALSYARDLPPNPTVLDVGCSYGHLLEVFRALGFQGTGIEPVDWLRERLNRSGQFAAYKAIEELPSGAQYNVVALIDSLYCFGSPLEAMKALATRLTSRGVMIIRVTNRTPLLNICRRYFKTKITNGIFGDQMFAFSHKGMSSIFHQTALKQRSFCFFENKPVAERGLKGFVYYRAAPAVAALTGLKITPGLTYLCTRDGDS